MATSLERKKMVSFKKISIVVFALFNLYNGVAGSSPDLTVVSEQCNAQTVRGQGLVTAVQKVLHDVVTITPLADSDFYCQIPVDESRTTFFFGHGACNGALTMLQCYSCLEAVADQIKQDCPSRYGANLQVKDCRVRYEFYPFTD